MSWTMVVYALMYVFLGPALMFKIFVIPGLILFALAGMGWLLTEKERGFSTTRSFISKIYQTIPWFKIFIGFAKVVVVLALVALWVYGATHHIA